MRRMWLIAGLLSLISVICLGAWLSQTPQKLDGATSPPTVAVHLHGSELNGGVDRPPGSTIRENVDTPVTRNDSANNRIPLRMAKDYAEYARRLQPEAADGDVESQYALSVALRYCQQNLKRYFLVAGKRPRTLDEAQVRWTTKSPAYQQEVKQQEIVDVYAHCHAFLEDSTATAGLQEWQSWLDKASDGGYPPAQVLKATLLRSETQLAEFSLDPSIHADPDATARSHDLAMSAVQSADPAVLWQMSGLVDERQLPQNEWGVVPAAWELLACARGYDCSAQAQWLRDACSTNPICIPGQTGQDYLKATLGSNFDNAQILANTINEKIKAKDWTNLPRFLWDVNLSN